MLTPQTKSMPLLRSALVVSLSPRLLSALLLMSLWASPVRAGLQFDLSRSLNGTAPVRADTTKDWYLRVTATDTTSGVNLTLTANLASTQFVGSIGFNVGEGVTPGGIFGVELDALDDFLPGFSNSGQGTYKVNGAGNSGKNFDVGLDFQTDNSPPSGRFSGIEQITLRLNGVSASDLDFTNGTPGVYFGAHIQGIPGDKSGFVGTTNSGVQAVPEPSDVILTLTGLIPAGLLIRRFRRTQGAGLAAGPILA